MIMRLGSQFKDTTIASNNKTHNTILSFLAWNVSFPPWEGRFYFSCLSLFPKQLRCQVGESPFSSIFHFWDLHHTVIPALRCQFPALGREVILQFSFLFPLPGPVHQGRYFTSGITQSLSFLTWNVDFPLWDGGLIPLVILRFSSNSPRQSVIYLKNSLRDHTKQLFLAWNVDFPPWEEQLIPLTILYFPNTFPRQSLINLKTPLLKSTQSLSFLAWNVSFPTWEGDLIPAIILYFPSRSPVKSGNRWSDSILYFI